MYNATKTFPHTYAMYCSKQLPNPKDHWLPYPYLVKISLYLFEQIVRGDCRIILCIPPRNGKTNLLQWTMLWFMESFGLNVIYTSYNNNQAKKNSKVIKDWPSLCSRIDLKTVKGHEKQEELLFTNGSEFLSAGPDGSITGSGGHLVLCDDLVKTWSHAMNKNKMQSLRDWFTGVLWNRYQRMYKNGKLQPGGFIILNTRWSKLDLIEYLLKDPKVGGHGNKWNIINLPAIAQDNDWAGRAPGTPLMPEFFPLPALMELKAGMNEANWEALYMQNPVSSESTYFKKKYLRFYTEVPREGEVVISCDPAVKGTSESDFNAFFVGKVVGNRRYLLKMDRFQGNIVEAVKRLKLLEEEFKPSEILMENKANGPAIQALLENEFPIKLLEPMGNKQERAISVIPDYNAGCFYVPDNNPPWLAPFLEELLNFPAADTDDQVDSFTQFMIEKSSFWGEKKSSDIFTAYRDLSRW